MADYCCLFYEKLHYSKYNDYVETRQAQLKPFSSKPKNAYKKLNTWICIIGSSVYIYWHTNIYIGTLYILACIIWLCIIAEKLHYLK